MREKMSNGFGVHFANFLAIDKKRVSAPFFGGKDGKRRRKTSGEHMRIDKFLKVSRILKRRTVAQEAASAGKVFVNGREVKPSYRLKVGDVVEIFFAAGALKFRVKELKETVKKDEAADLYEVIA